ncbi:double-stranded DNA repair protein [Vibrio phage vB_VchM_Kuja]|uniref:Double-stranded DNA repair protein n=1 Tax=Vibrio phage vB_VchM_Kuja TaxID=2686437 RepID=A0A6B9JAN7_9CAUD|nr:double-stranded DNA repair protein [Vibrio phage vB_VchM_Kuja]QGZ16006.1 double-stranded DNA repair protein [Vibrio phage vB_VchM_Kuja]
MNFLDTLKPITPDPTPVPFSIGEFTQSHKLTFLCGRAKNFRSIGNNFMEISYVDNRSTLVISDENGAGKSTTTVWLIYYAVTGQPYYKKEKVGSLVNSQTRKDMVVELEFLSRGVHYKIVRGRKPDIFELHVKEGDQFVKYQNDAANFDLQNYIWTILGLEPKSGAKMLENACIMGLERFQPFLTMSSEDRRLMVESVWDLGIFRHLTEEAKTSRAITKNKLTEISTEIGQMEVELRMCQNNLNHIDEAIEKRDLSWRDEVLRHKASVNALEDKIAEHNRSIEMLMLESNPEANEKYKRIQKQIDDLNDELNLINDRFSKALDEEIQLLDEKRKNLESQVKSAKMDFDNVSLMVDDKENELYSSRETETLITNRLTEVQSKLEEVKEKLNKTKSFQPKIEFELQNAKERLVKFQTLGECPTCEQCISADKMQAVEAETLPKIQLSTEHKERLDAAIAKQQEEVQAVLVAVEAVRTELTQAQAKTRTLLNELNNLQAEKSRKSATLQRAEADLEHCPKDNEQIKKQNKLSQDNEANSIKLSIQKLERERDLALENAPKQIETIKASIQAAEASIIAINESHQANIKRREDEVNQLAADKNNMFMNVGAAEAELERLNETYNNVDKDLNEYDFIIDMLGEKEGKADVVRMYLPFLNAKINEYLSGMNINLALELDETFEPSMKTHDRNGQTLFSLSSGQRARVDLAIVFALRDVANLKASFQCNILIMDEILESLSGIGVTEAVAMIKNKFHQNNLFIITQRNEEFVEFFDHQVKYSLRDGFTTVL